MIELIHTHEGVKSAYVNYQGPSVVNIYIFIVILNLLSLKQYGNPLCGLEKRLISHIIVHFSTTNMSEKARNTRSMSQQDQYDTILAKLDKLQSIDDNVADISVKVLNLEESMATYKNGLSV